MENLFDVIIVGGGPAGLSAAIYMARARYRVLLLEKDRIGGQITITAEIVNYPGVEKSSGTELTQGMLAQAEAFGAEFAAAEVFHMDLSADIKVLHTTAGTYRALGVILATGANPRKLGFKGEKEFQGRGVAYCATCDGEFFTGLEVFVIGGGFAAVEEGIFLTKYARKVTMIVREEDFTCAKTVSEQVYREPKMEVHFHTEIVEAGGDSMVRFVRFRDNVTQEEWSYEAEDEALGIFVFAGYVPNTEWLGGKVACDQQGYLITDENQKTNVDGVYGAGDVCIKNLRQVVTAVSDGAVAATALEKYVSALHERLGIPELARPKADTGKLGRQKQKTAEQTDNRFLSSQIRQTLMEIFARFEKHVVITAELDDTPLSGEIRGFLNELEELGGPLRCEQKTVKETDRQSTELYPAIRIGREDGSGGNLLFHGVPGGHEFNSFIAALYNMAGPGQAIEEALVRRIRALRGKKNIKVMVSLSCTMCPEVVMAAQRIAALNGQVTAEMVDLAHYPEWKQKYQIMSVPCMVIDEKELFFGRKNLEEVLEILEKRDEREN